MIKHITPDSLTKETRLDQYLSQIQPEYSRSYFSNLIKSGHVTVNAQPAKPSTKVNAGDVLEYDLVEKPSLGPILAEDIPLEVIFENDDVAVINKQAGLVVHPAAGNYQGTLVNALAHKYSALTKVVYEEGNDLSESRPGLVHRLDKDTSGVIIVAKNTKAMIFLSNQIKERLAEKIYLAICSGWPKKEAGTLTNYLGRNPKDRLTYTEVGPNKGRKAVSTYKTIKFYKTKKGQKISLIEFCIETGRTHQIRAQAKLAGFPLIGDKNYNNRDSLTSSAELGAKRQMLHAKSLSILLPSQKSNDTRQSFEAPLPADFENVIAELTTIE